MGVFPGDSGRPERPVIVSERGRSLDRHLEAFERPATAMSGVDYDRHV